MWFSKLSIKNKMLIISIPALFVMIIIGLLIIRSITVTALDKNQKASLRIIGDLAVEAVRMGVEFGDQEMVTKAMSAFTKDEQMSLIKVTDDSGKDFFYYRKKGFSTLDVSNIHGFKEAGNEIFIHLPILSKSKQIGSVLVGISLQERNAVLRTATNVLLLLSFVGILLIILFVIVLAKYFNRPINGLKEMAIKLSKGQVKFQKTYKYKDEMGSLMDAFQILAESISAKAQMARNLASGNMNTDIEVLSEEDELGNALLEVKESLQTIITELKSLVTSHKNGEIDARCKTHNLQGAYKNVITNLNEALNVIVDPLKQTIVILNEYASGNLEHQLKPLPGVLMQLTEALNAIRTNLRELINESVQLTEHAKAGNLNYRGEVEKFEGGYRAILSGYNEAMDAIVHPLNESAAAIAAISRGEIPPPIETDFNGDFNTLKENINLSIKAINNLIHDSNALIDSALEGHLQLRVDDSKHQGDFRKIVGGINESLDALTFPMNEILDALEKIAGGDLSVKITSEHKGDHGRMKDALNKTLDSLNEILANIANAVEQIRSGAHQVADSSQSVSGGATEQASSLEETTASIEEVAAQSKHNSEHASMANKISMATQNAAQEGNNLMSKMLDAMQAINESSNQISKIIKVIDEIAFQTNLLSLNAAVEAARAGVHGKGFAVVAEEVRNLAQRSAKAAKETEQLIEGSVQKVRYGTEIADKTAKSLSTIISNITKVNDLIDEITSASAEQVQGIEQISEALKQVDQVTQANAASAEQSASAAEELSSQAKNLQGLVGKFHLKNYEFSPEEHKDYAFAYESVKRPLKAKRVPGNGHNGNGSADNFTLDDDQDFGEF